jgi:DNA-binding NarL/FixJ family response regulator
MILYIDDEPGRTLRWREALQQLAEVRELRTAAEALELFSDSAAMRSVRLVVLDLAMYTTGDLTETDTGLGRLTGDALRRRLRKTGWKGPVLVLTNASDDAIRAVVEAEGDTFRRKSECRPSALKELAASLLR